MYHLLFSLITHPNNDVVSFSAINLSQLIFISCFSEFYVGEISQSLFNGCYLNIYKEQISHVLLWLKSGLFYKSFFMKSLVHRVMKISGAGGSLQEM